MAAEIEVVVAAVTGALTGGLVKPFLAPVEALSDHWRDRIRGRLETVADSARRKRGTTALSVNERVGYRVLSEAAFTDDAIVLEYLAGVVAGSSLDDDDGAPVLAQISRLSSFQLRLHYVIYREFWRLAMANGSVDLAHDTWRSLYPIYLPATRLEAVFDQDFDSLGARLDSTGRWLRREGLVRDGSIDDFRVLAFGERLVVTRERRPATVYQPPDAGLIVTGSAYGLELLAWACGAPRGDLAAASRQAPEFVEFSPPIEPCPATRLRDLPSHAQS